MIYEQQGTSYDIGASGHELQGRDPLVYVGRCVGGQMDGRNYASSRPYFHVCRNLTSSLTLVKSGKTPVVLEYRRYDWNEDKKEWHYADQS